MTGEGEVLYGSETIPAQQALHEMALQPCILTSRDALALVNVHHFRVHIYAWRVERSRRLLVCAEDVTGLDNARVALPYEWIRRSTSRCKDIQDKKNQHEIFCAKPVLMAIPKTQRVRFKKFTPFAALRKFWVQCVMCFIKVRQPPNKIERGG